MAKHYSVPMVAQRSSNTCWDAAAWMIWQYWQSVSGRQGPMYSLLAQYSANKAISVPEWIQLAQNVGMKAIPGPIGVLDAKDIEEWLIKYGPLWCAGPWYGLGHIVVLTGVDEDYVYLNDPDRGVKKQHDIAWFNSRLWKNYPGCVLYKDPKAY